MSATEKKSMPWDHAGLKGTHFSEGQEDKQLLEALDSLDPCEEYDDSEFAERLQGFLQEYEKNVRINPTEETDLKLSSGTSESTCEMN